MKAVTFQGPGHIRVESVADPSILEPGDAIVRVTMSAICGSDLHLYRRRLTGVEPGIVIGHEYVGIVEEVGEGVFCLRPGDRVVGSFHTACGHCWFCRRGLFSQCQQGALFGFGRRFGDLPGTQAEYARVPHADFTLHQVPADIGDERAVFIGDILATAYFAVNRAEVRVGDTVGVIGCGPVGLLAVMCAQTSGASRVIAVDVLEPRLHAARQLGAATVNGRDQDPVRAIRDQTGKRGADAMIEAVGSAETLRLACQAVRGFGTVSAAGVFTEESLAFPAGRAFSRDLTVRLGMANVPAQFEAVTELIRHGRIDPAVLISHTLRLDEAADGYRLFDAGEGLKVLLKP